MQEGSRLMKCREQREKRENKNIEQGGSAIEKDMEHDERRREMMDMRKRRERRKEITFRVSRLHTNPSLALF